MGTKHGDDAIEIFVCVRRLSDRADFTFFDERVHQRGRFRKVIVLSTLIVGPDEGSVVKVINVNIVGSEVSKRLFTLIADVSRVIAVGGGSLEMADLGGDHLGLAFDVQASKRKTESSFGATVAIDIGVVPMIHSSIQADANAVENVVVVHAGPTDGLSRDRTEVRSAHCPTAESDFGDFDAGRANFSVAHIFMV
jgi:hypothetical protein